MITKKEAALILRTLGFNTEKICFVGSLSYKQQAKDADVVISSDQSEILDEILVKYETRDKEYSLISRIVKRGSHLYSFYFENGRHIDIIRTEDDDHYNFVCQFMSADIPTNIKLRNNLLRTIAYLKGYSIDFQRGLFATFLKGIQTPRYKLEKENEHYKVVPVESKRYYDYEFISDNIDDIAKKLFGKIYFWNDINTAEKVLRLIDLTYSSEVAKAIKIFAEKL